MNNKKSIRRNFDFLCDYGLLRKQYDNGTDCEIYYYNANIEIGIICAMGFSNDLVQSFIRDNHYEFPHDMDFKQFEKNVNDSTREGVEIVISKDGKRFNLLCCDFFDKSLLNELKESISHCKNDIEKAITIYSQFIRKYLKQIL